MPGFWDSYTKPERVEGSYLKTSDFAGKTVVVFDVIEQGDNSYNGKPNPRFLLKVVTESGDEGLMAFSMGYTGRDDTIKALGQFLADGGDPVTVAITKTGNFLDIEAA